MDGLLGEIRTRINSSALAGKVYVGKLAQQDDRIGFYATQPGSKTLTFSFAPTLSGGGTNFAGQDLHLSNGQKMDVDHPELNPPPEALGGYELTLRAETGNTAGAGSIIAVLATTDAAVHLEAGLQDRPVMIPLGDINGDGYQDFIGAVRDNGSQSLAYVYFGSPDLTAASLQRYTCTLMLPAQVSQLTPALLTNAVTFAPASLISQPTTLGSQTILRNDFNGDGLSDMALAVSGNYGTNATTAGVYLLLGRRDAFGIIGARTVPQQGTIGAMEFQLSVDGARFVTVQVPQTTRANLLQDLNAALKTSGLDDRVEADLVGDRLRLNLKKGQSLEITFASPDVLTNTLGFTYGQRNALSAPLTVVARPTFATTPPLSMGPS
jgi:hypothetical protein